jgi:hypothetical protein
VRKLGEQLGSQIALQQRKQDETAEEVHPVELVVCPLQGRPQLLILREEVCDLSCLLSRPRLFALEFCSQPGNLVLEARYPWVLVVFGRGLLASPGSGICRGLYVLGLRARRLA